MSKAHRYSLFGLVLDSELELPEVVAGDADALADVTISLGMLDAPPSDHGLQAMDDRLLLTVPDVARYLIAHGNAITIEALPSVPARNVRLFLLGSAFGALLHQRGLLPLHANAVEIAGQAIAFMGPSGSGKSTLAAWFHDHGHRVITDDVCVVSTRDDRAFVAPGLPRLRLWAEAIAATRRDPSGFQRSYVGDTPYEKFDVPLGTDSLAPAPLAAAYVLGQGRHLTIERLAGSAAAEAIFANTYRGAFVEPAGQHVRHWSVSTALVRTTPIFRLDRRWGFDVFDAEAEAVLRHAMPLLGRR